MGYGSATGYESPRWNAEEVGPVRAALMWLLYSVALTVVVAVALVCVPFVVVWCLLFDAD